VKFKGLINKRVFNDIKVSFAWPVLIMLTCNACSSFYYPAIDNDNLVLKNDLHYQKGCARPYTGKVTGSHQYGTYYTYDLVDGKIHGVYRAYESGIVSDSLTFEANYKNGELDGVMKSYYGDGSIKEESYYQYGKKHGENINYNKDGTLSSKTPYVNGKIEGIMKIYRNKSHWEIPYIKGSEEGFEKKYSQNGILLQSIPCVNGERHGVSKVYNEDGTYKGIVVFVNGYEQRVR
jgi:antitoxin component YwqK of YwqJK toxin-antitoxin module